MDPQQLTIAGILIAIGLAGVRKDWVFGWVYRAKVESDQQSLLEMTSDRDFWRDIALKSMGHTEKALDVAGRRTRDG
jgi:hypothetical protein